MFCKPRRVLVPIHGSQGSGLDRRHTTQNRSHLLPVSRHIDKDAANFKVRHSAPNQMSQDIARPESLSGVYTWPHNVISSPPKRFLNSKTEGFLAGSMPPRS